MGARKILGHLTDAARRFAAASRHAGKAPPIESPEAVAHAKAASDSLAAAVALVTGSPTAGARVAEAARRAFDDAHRRAVSRRADLDAHGLDEGGVAACAAEGAGLDVVDVRAGGADEEGLHEGERTPVGYLPLFSASFAAPTTDAARALYERVNSRTCACGAPSVFDLVDGRAGHKIDRVCERCAAALRDGMVQ